MTKLSQSQVIELMREFADDLAEETEKRFNEKHGFGKLQAQQIVIEASQSVLMDHMVEMIKANDAE